MTYKPKDDAYLLRMKNCAPLASDSDRLLDDIEAVVEQCRRANRLAEAVAAYRSLKASEAYNRQGESKKRRDEMDEALRLYRGGEP